MGRVYKKKLGSRVYNKSCSENIELALKDVVDGKMSLRASAKKYGLSYGTLSNRYHGKHIKPAGGQLVLSMEEEAAVSDALLLCSDWGFPMQKIDLPFFVKSLLDSIGKTISKFNLNTPGEGWVESFLQRNHRLSERWASNITRNRAKVSAETINEYFANLHITTSQIPASHIFNYDETNVVDDPGKKKCIYRRGTKYPEKVCNHSKSALTLMLCGSADGTLLPPYVVYKSANMWDTWTRGGPKNSPCCSCKGCSRGSRYNRTTHGWMEMSTFADWFHSTFMPHAARLDGKKVLIGDNLASHFSPSVLKTCQEHNIAFACLPTNSTYICQPLDVAFFRPFKLSWRQVLTKARKYVSSSGLQKDRFPSLLKETLEAMDSKKEGGAIKSDLISGFKACGIYPLDANQVLKKLPPSAEADLNASNVSTALLDFLRKERHGAGNKIDNGIKTRKSKLAVQPGKSVVCPSSSSSSGDDFELSLNDSSESENDPSESEQEEEENKVISVGDFVICTYDKQEYPGSVLQLDDDGTATITFLQKGKKSWFWPTQPDTLVYGTNDISRKINPPKELKNGYISVPELEL